MNILLDTVSFIMIVSHPEQLSVRAKKLYLNEENLFFLSVVSGWEIIVKNQLGKLDLLDTPEKILTDYIVGHDIEIIPLLMEDILQLSKITSPKTKRHKDPFDRMLVCQSKARNMPILTPDIWLQKYDIKTLW